MKNVVLWPARSRSAIERIAAPMTQRSIAGSLPFCSAIGRKWPGRI